MYFKLYEIIEISFFKKFNRNITKKEILFILNNIIKNNILRKIVINNYILFKIQNKNILLQIIFNIFLIKITNNKNSIGKI